MQLPDHIPSPMTGLAKNSAGYPIPWFVQRDPADGGNPDFRIMDASRLVSAVTQRLCWVCGTRIGSRRHTFVAGPMCLVNHTSAEPPSHYACAEWSARACPFLTNPNKVRREGNLPENAGESGGVMIARNPGVTALIVMTGRKNWAPARLPNGVIFKFGEPEEVQWYAEGREATREEVEESLRTGLEVLLKEAGPPEGIEAIQLMQMLSEARQWLPDP